MNSDLVKAKLASGLLKFVEKNIVNAPTEKYAKDMISWLDTLLDLCLYPTYSPSQMLVKFRDSDITDKELEANYEEFWKRLLRSINNSYDDEDYRIIVVELCKVA